MTEYEKLTDRLADWLSDVTEDRADTAQLDAILDALDALDPPPDEPDPAEALARFHQDYASLFAKAEAERRKKPAKRADILRRLVLAAAILLTAMITAQALGVDVFGAIGKWTKESFHFGSAADHEIVVTQYPMSLGEEVEYASLEEALAAFGIEAPIVPRWIPERFRSDAYFCGTVTPSGAFAGATYRSEDALLSISIHETDDQYRMVTEKDDREPESYYKGTYHHYILFDGDYVKALWRIDCLECCICAPITEEEMKQMIDSMYE